jgi:PAS domain S-box-containing protein
LNRTFSQISKYAWLPIPLFIALVLYTEISGVSNAHENRLLLLISNIVFTTLGSLLITYLMSRSILKNGRIGLILFVCGVLFWGFSGSIGTLFGYQNANVIVTIHNLCAFFSSLFYFTGALAWSGRRSLVKTPALWMTVLYSLSIIIIAIIVLSATVGKAPVFFVDNVGGTAFRYILLILTIILFLATSVLLRIRAKNNFLSQFLHWYSLALVLISIGITGIMLEHQMGDVLSWTGRSAQFLGGLYMIISSFVLVDETKVWAITIADDLNTKREQAENERRKSEDRYRRIVELAGESIIIIDDKLIISEWNRAAESLYGWKAEEVIGKNVRSILRTEGSESEMERIMNDLRENGVARYEGTQRTKNNNKVVVDAHISVIRDDYNIIAGYIIINRDITEIIAAQNELRLAKEVIERSEERLRIALENANVGLWEWDFTSEELIWNERTEVMFGVKPGTFSKTLQAFEDLVHEEDLPRLMKGFKVSSETGNPFESVFRLKSTSRYISSKAFVVKDQNGKAKSMLGVCFDVTSFKQESDKAMFILNQELSRSNKDLENFAYVASHDLQEPLRMVTSFTQLLQQRYADKLDEDANTFIRYAVEGSKRMYELLNGLLSFSRVKTTGKEFARVDMNSVVKKVMSNLRLKMEETSTRIVCGELPEITADENQMIQMIQNLVENGIKFSKKGSEITISSELKDGFDIFSVKDQGIGIESQYYERIFRIFQRLHLKEEYEGMGIGLSICQRIVQRHGGNIWVESVPGKGSTFHFSIPANT